MRFNHLKPTLLEEAPSGEEAGGGEAPVVETPNEAPVVPAVELPNEESQEVTPKTEDDIPEKTEPKSKLSQVTELVEKAGLDIVDLAKYAKENDGEVSLEDLVKLKETHGDAIASLLVDQIKGIHDTNKAAATKKDQEVYDQVAEAFKDVTEQSGEETWKELATWSKENVSDSHRAELNNLLAMGGLATKLAVQELTSAFKESQGTQEFQEVDLMEADRLSGSNIQPISKSDYNRELNALLDKGHVYGESSEIAKLDARRSKTLRTSR